jgi:iron complex outermembrane receptor protein
MGSLLKRLVLSASFLTASLAPLPMYGAEPGVLKGRVVDKTDGEGVVGASVVIAGTNIGTSTDINGNFVIRNVPASAQKVSVSIVGYAPVTQVVKVGEGQTSTANFSLGQTTIMASEVVVGAALYKQDRLSIPVTANVVSKEKIKQEPNPSLDRVIEDVPGVVMTRAGGQTTSSVQIRGSNTYQGGGIGTRVQAFYDGFPINIPDSGELVLPAVNMNAADKVEVLKGAAATLYGSGAMGGVINASGAMPEKMEVKFGASTGYYDAPPESDQSTYRKNYTPFLYNGYFGIGNKSGKWTYNSMFTHSEDDGYRQNAWTNLSDMKLKVRYDINSKQYLQVTSFYNTSVGGYAYSWPYDFYAIPSPTFTPHPENAYDSYVNAKAFMDNSAMTAYLLANPGQPITVAGTTMTIPSTWPKTVYYPSYAVLNASQYAALINGFGKGVYDYKLYDVYGDDTIARKNALVGLNYVNLLSDKLTLDTRLYYTYNETRIEYNRTNASQTYATGTVRAVGDFNENDANRFGVGAKLDWRALDNHRLLFGVDGNIMNLSTTQDAAEKPVTNMFHDIKERNFASFVQDEWKMTEKLTSLLSLRYDWSGIDKSQAQLDNLTWVNIKDSVSAVSPRVAMNYKATDDTSFRASWGKSFRAPTLTERFVRDGGLFRGIINPNLDKETMTAYEVGAFKQFSDKVSVDVAGFINNYDNLIESIIDQTSMTFQYRNITKARIWGVETSVNYRPNANWMFNAAYTYMNAKNRSYKLNENPTLDKNPSPDWLPMRPEHTASASATWKAAKGLSLNVNGRYVGKYKAVNLYSNPQGNFYPGNFVVFNAGAKYQFSQNVSGSLTCRNLNNTQYEEAEWFRAPGRSFVAGIDLTY